MEKIVKNGDKNDNFQERERERGNIKLGRGRKKVLTTLYQKKIVKSIKTKFF